MKLLGPVLKYLKDFGFKSHFYKMFISILLCMLLPGLLVGFISYGNSSSVLIEQAVDQKGRAVDQINQLLGDYFQKIQQAIWSVYNNPYIKVISSYPFDYDDYVAILKCMDYMKADINKAGIYDMFIYITSLDLYITSGQIRDNQDFFLRQYGCSLAESRALTEAMKRQDHYNEYIPFVGNFDERVYCYNIEPDDRAILVLTTLKVTGRPVLQAGAVVRRSSIEDMLGDELTDESESLSLMSGTGDTYFHVGASYGGDESAVVKMIGETQGKAPSGLQHSVIHNANVEYLVNYTRNPETGYYIISRIPMSMILDKIQSIKQMMLILCLAALVVSLFVSFFLSVFFYRPVTTLLDSMQSGGMGAAPRESDSARKDEYSLISNNYIRMTSEYSAMKDVMDKNRTMMIARLFRRLCQNKYNNPSEVQERVQDLALSYAGKKFTAYVISPDGLAGLNRDGQMDLIKLESLYRCMSDSIREAVEPVLDVQVVTFNEYEMLGVVINHDLSDEYLNKWFADHYRELFGAYQDQYDVTFSVGLGSSVDSLDQLKTSYSQAREALENRFFLGFGKIHTYAAKPIENIPYGIERQESLLNAILQGNRKQALQETLPVLKQCFSDGRCRASAMKRLMREMLTVVSDVFREENISLSAVFGDDFDLFHPIEQFDTFNESLNHVRQIIETACQWIQENSRRATEKQRDIFMAYIEAHYAEEIMLHTIAEEFHFSPSYFSRYFKLVTGNTFIDCITQVRISKAMEMLGGDMAIKDVYPKVGYNNYNTFRRAFKKITSLSPESYKKSIRATCVNMGGKAAKDFHL